MHSDAGAKLEAREPSLDVEKTGYRFVMRGKSLLLIAEQKRHGLFDALNWKSWNAAGCRPIPRLISSGFVAKKESKSRLSDDSIMRSGV